MAGCMTMAYGTKVRGSQDFAKAEAEARARHEHYYTEAAGWCYRAEPVRYAAIHPYADPVSGEGEWYTTDPVIELFAFPVVRWTPCGATIKDIHGGSETRFADLRPGAKAYASRTAQEAVLALRRRRNSQVYVLAKKLVRAKREIALCECVLGEGDYATNPLLAAISND